jgi:hypothetical protein
MPLRSEKLEVTAESPDAKRAGFFRWNLGWCLPFPSMDMILGFLAGTGGLVLLGVAVAFGIGWFILASRAKRLNEIT